MDADLMKELRILLDKQEIREVMLRQSRGLDRGEAELLSTIFHPGAERLTPAGPNAEPEGQLKIVGGYADDQPPSSHFLGNQLIEVDGDVAASETYFVAFAQVIEEGKLYTRMRGGRYLDRFERRDGAWRITFRVMTDDWSRIDEVLRTVNASATSFPGRPSREDPLYVRMDLSDRS
jgi:hypothetical protein